jgi:hypothetical protein
MKVDGYIEIDNLEDLAAIAWNRAIVRKQRITVRCPDPEGFIPTLLKINSGLEDIFHFPVKEFERIFEMAKLLENSTLMVERANAYSYSMGVESNENAAS